MTTEMFDAVLASAPLSPLDFDARLKALETSAATVTPAVRDDVLFPGDYIKNVNRGRIELADFNVAAEVAKAEAIAAGAKANKDPFKGRTAP